MPGHDQTIVTTSSASSLPRGSGVNAYRLSQGDRMSVHRYWMYGIGVHSEIPLWGDGIADCPRDIGVLCREADTPERQTGLDGQLNDLDVIHLDWPSVCSLSVRAGAEIV